MNGQIREIAHKLWISDLNNAEFKNGGLVVWGDVVSRVNLVGSIVGKYGEGESYVSLTVDDGSAGIRIKAWSEDVRRIRDVGLGDVVLVVGRLKQSSNGEVFVSPEVVRKVCFEWELARKLELIKEFGFKKEVGFKKQEGKLVANDFPEAQEESSVEVVEVVKIGSIRQMILDCVKKGNGMTFDEIKREIDYPEEETDSAIQELLNEGEIYETKGVYRLLG
ncbi:MAG: hypothetical protein KKG60_02210 [Nanoarchaeota archaeon]|nr:hypothetical protein [Nanoarchaeota archaeon]